MADIMWFAIYSARRQSEICRLRWTDNDLRNFTGLVRDLKHPRHKIGNHQRFRYTPEGWKIAMGQSRTDEFIFPFKAASIKESFRVACRKLGIENLRFHDLRHEATSRLFECGPLSPVTRLSRHIRIEANHQRDRSSIGNAFRPGVTHCAASKIFWYGSGADLRHRLIGAAGEMSVE
jgi:integrase